MIVRRPRPTFWNPPGPGTRPGAAEEGVRPGGFDLRTLWKAPSLLVDSVRRRPPLFPIPSSVCSFPISLGVPPPPTPSSRPWWSQAGPRKEFPLRGSPCGPTPAIPKILGSMFTFSFKCQQRGSLQEAPVWAEGAGRGCLLFPALTFTQGERYTSQGRRVPQSRHYGCLTECVWHFFFNLLISFTCSPPAHRA